MSSAKYMRLNESNDSLRVSSSARKSLVRWTLCVIAGLLASIMVFQAGRNLVYASVQDNVPLGTVDYVFTFNQTFGEPPSPVTDAAWAEIFPEQGGYFRHPTLAPDRSAFSVFHLLHCLNGIREGYWTVYDAAVAGVRLDPDSIPFMASPRHIRHCIDLLRNSLMCYPDTTIEVKDEDVGGVLGFGTRHNCRNYGQLLDWTRQWEDWHHEGHGSEQLSDGEEVKNEHEVHNHHHHD